MKKESYEFKDSSVELAVEKGLNYLGLKRSEVEISIKSVGGIFKKACVELTPVSGAVLTINESALEEKVVEEIVEEPKEEIKVEEKKEDSSKKLEEPKEKSTAKKDKTVEKKEKEVKELLDEDDDNGNVVLKNPATQEDMKIAFEGAKDFIDTVISLLETDSVVEYEKGYDSIKVNIQEGNLSRTIGYRGETLDAIQYLASIFSNFETEGFVRVQVDAGDYREKRTESLVRLANNLARKCIRSKRDQIVEPLNAFERRIIHVTLQEHDKVETESRGDGPLKEVVIKFKKSKNSIANEVEEDEIEYGTTSDFQRKGTRNLRSFGNKKRRF